MGVVGPVTLAVEGSAGWDFLSAGEVPPLPSSCPSVFEDLPAENVSKPGWAHHLSLLSLLHFLREQMASPLSSLERIFNQRDPLKNLLGKEVSVTPQP